MSAVEVIQEEPVAGRRLGRHVEHDPRSRDFAFLHGRAAVPIRSRSWTRYGKPFDQGDLGSCTGNAACGAANTKPLHKTGTHLLTETDAVSVYSDATKVDGYPGSYPPDDTGSSGLAVAKVLLGRGTIRAYQHAFGIPETLQALMSGPVITGVNWYEGFDEPDANGRVSIAGQVRGGHEFEVVGIHVGKDTHAFADAVVTAVNSWGTTWGKNGRFSFTVATWQQLLTEKGDVTILLP